MTQEKLEEKLKKLIFEKDKPFVVSISGEWGVGKTYFLQKFFIEKFIFVLSHILLGKF